MHGDSDPDFVILLTVTLYHCSLVMLFQCPHLTAMFSHLYTFLTSLHCPQLITMPFVTLFFIKSFQIVSFKR